MRTLIALMLISGAANAAPILKVSGDDFSITLHNEPCTLKSEVTNLKMRAVWREAGKEIEGCWGVQTQFKLVTLYFADKTATSVPASIFREVEGA